MNLLFLSFIIIVNFVNSVIIDCRTQSNWWTPFGNLKECLTYEVISDEHDREVTQVKTYDTLETYKSFYINESPNCYYLPKGLSKYFSNNLQTIIIARSGLNVITKDDLEPFKNLRGLYIDFCNIKRLKSDLFIYTPSIEQLSLQDNGIEYVEEGIFKPLTKLSSFDFSENKCLDKKADGIENVKRLFTEIEEKCEPLEIIESLEEIKDETTNKIEIDKVVEKIEEKQKSSRMMWVYIFTVIAVLGLIFIFVYLVMK
ncbi:hypothetical protein PVAND_003179 [Polypedilum vanderplanki]|uniref:Uncharacterized protein n=1 Tax=Polypedilum vanderplanki TaxID=319348 RepID=A0A9J6BT91_POLVA|nr:hypothetical protein PVAND_003179 [Polypedilum vanderplanki]